MIVCRVNARFRAIHYRNVFILVLGKKNLEERYASCRKKLPDYRSKLNLVKMILLIGSVYGKATIVLFLNYSIEWSQYA